MLRCELTTIFQMFFHFLSVPLSLFKADIIYMIFCALYHTPAVAGLPPKAMRESSPCLVLMGRLRAQHIS